MSGLPGITTSSTCATGSGSPASGRMVAIIARPCSIVRYAQPGKPCSLMDTSRAAAAGSRTSLDGDASAAMFIGVRPFSTGGRARSDLGCPLWNPTYRDVHCGRTLSGRQVVRLFHLAHLRIMPDSRCPTLRLTPSGGRERDARKLGAPRSARRSRPSRCPHSSEMGA
jgi:hypothetical protein